MLSEDGGSCCTQHISLVLAMGSWAELFSSLLLKTPKTKFLAKKPQKPSSVHVGELAGATKITEDTKELLTCSFCEALWLLTWKSTHSSEGPLCAGQGCGRGGCSPCADLGSFNGLVWGQEHGPYLPPPVQSCAGAWAVLLGPPEPPLNLTAGLIHSRPHSHVQRAQPKLLRHSRWEPKLDLHVRTV